MQSQFSRNLSQNSCSSLKSCIRSYILRIEWGHFKQWPGSKAESFRGWVTQAKSGHIVWWRDLWVMSRLELQTKCNSSWRVRVNDCEILTCDNSNETKRHTERREWCPALRRQPHTEACQILHPVGLGHLLVWFVSCENHEPRRLYRQAADKDNESN